MYNKSQKPVCLLAKLLQLSLNLGCKIALLYHVRIDVNANVDVEDVEILVIEERPLVMHMATDVDYSISFIAMSANEALSTRTLMCQACHRRIMLDNAVILANVAEENFANCMAAVVLVVVSLNEDDVCPKVC